MVTPFEREEHADNRGGQNTKLAPYLLQSGEYTLLQNCWLDSRGQIEKRPGYTKFCTSETSPPACAITGLEPYYYSNGSTISEDVIYWRGGKAYRESACAASISCISGATGFSTTAITVMQNAKNRLYGVNGVASSNWVLDNVTFYAAGLTAPASTATVATGAAGAMTGSYYYRITYDYGSRGESNASAASAVVAPVAKRVELTAIPTAGVTDGVGKRHIYRTIADAASTASYYFVATLSDNTTTTYTDNATDAELGDELETDNDAAPTSAYMVWWKNMMVYAGNPAALQRLYVSKIGIPESVPAVTNFIDVPTPGDVITGMVALPDVLLVFTDSTVWALTGGAPENFQFRNVEPQIGCTAPYSIATYNGAAYWMSFQRVYRSYGGAADPISDNIDNAWIPSLRDNLRSARATVWNGKLLLAIFQGSTAFASSAGAADDTAANNTIWVLDLILKDQAEDGRSTAWYKWSNFPVNVFAVVRGPTVNREKLLWGTKKPTGLVFLEDDGGASGTFSDNGTAITMAIQTQDHAAGRVGLVKKWRVLEAIFLGATGLSVTAYSKVDQAASWTTVGTKTLDADRGTIRTVRWRLPGQTQGHFARFGWQESSTSYLLFYSYETQHQVLRNMEA